MGRAVGTALATVGAFACLLFVASAAQAATITVTALSDDVTANGTCTLREAISEANANLQTTSADCVFDTTQAFGNDTINLDPGTFELQIDPIGGGDNQDGDFDINLGAGSLTISGAGEGATTVDGNDKDRVFDLIGAPAPAPGNPLTIRDLTVRDGKTIVTPHHGGGLFAGAGAPAVTIDGARFLSNEAASVGGSGGGGGISFFPGVNGASLTVMDSTISENTTAGSEGGGGIFVQGAFSTVDIVDSSVSDNDALRTAASSPAAGIALTQFSPTTVRLSGTTVAGNDNRGTEGGGISLGPGNQIPALTIEGGSRITGNFARDMAGGGANARGAGIMALPLNTAGTNTLVIRDSEVSGNDAAFGSGGGVYFNTTVQGNRLELNRATVSSNTAGDGGGVHAGGTVEVLNSTLSGNAATEVGNTGGVFVLNNSILELRHSTVADNLGAGAGIDGVNVFNLMSTFEATGSIIADDPGDGLANDACGGASTTDLGYNIDDGTSCGLTAVGSMPSTNPMLGPLEANGGLVLTRALLPGSAAIDLVPQADCDDLAGGALAVDARELARPFPAGGMCDSGAYELRDADGDGLLDTSDGCPADVGPATNSGCPLVLLDPPVDPPVNNPPNNPPATAPKCPKGKKPKKVKGKAKCVKKKKRKKKKR